MNAYLEHSNAAFVFFQSDVNILWMYIQSKIPSALCGIHNFIHIHVPQVEVNEAENYDLHGNAGDHIVHGVGYVVVDDIKEGDVAAQ